VGAKQPLLGRSRAPLGEIGNFVSNVASRAVEKFAGGDPRCVDTAARGPGAAAVGPRKRADSWNGSLCLRHGRERLTPPPG